MKISPKLSLVLSLALVRVAFVWTFADAKAYHRLLPMNLDRLALLVAEEKKTGFPTAWGSYYLILGGFYKVLGALSLLAERYYFVAGLNAILGCLSVWLFLKIAERVFPDQFRLQMFLTLLFGLYYPSYYLNLLNLSENFYTPLLLWIVLLALKVEEPKKSLLSFIGVLFGFAILIRPVGLTFAVFLPIWLYKKIGRFGARQLVASALCYALPLVLVLFVGAQLNRQFHTRDVATIAGNGAVNMTMSWCNLRQIHYKLDSGEGFWFEPPARLGNFQMSILRTEVPFSDSGYYYRYALKCLLDNPMQLLWNLQEVHGVFWSTLYPRFHVHPLQRELISFWRLLAFILFLGYSFFPILVPEGNEKWQLGTWLLASLLIPVYLSTSGEERYLVPYYFVLILWGVPGLLEMKKRLANASTSAFST